MGGAQLPTLCGSDVRLAVGGGRRFKRISYSLLYTVVRKINFENLLKLRISLNFFYDTLFKIYQLPKLGAKITQTTTKFPKTLHFSESIY